jgi:hypothetical protein
MGTPSACMARSHHAWPWPERPMASSPSAKRRRKHRAFRGETVTRRWPTHSYMRTQKWRSGRECSLEESFLRWRACRRGGGTGEGSKEWSRRPEKWSGRSSLVVWNSLQEWRGWGTTRGGCYQWGAHGGRQRHGNRRCPASLADAAGRFSVQEGRGDGVLLLVRSDNSEVAHR